MARPADPQPALGRAIREFRVRADMTQEQLGLDSGIGSAWISHLESGSNPSWSTARRIADALGVRLSELAARAEELERA